MKYLTKFNTDSQYQEKKNGFELVNVSYIEDIDEVRYWKFKLIPRLLLTK